MCFAEGSALSGFFKGAYSAGIRNLHLEPLNVMAESDTLFHEIGNVTHLLNPAGDLYYVRWIKPAGAEWEIAFDSMVVGKPWKAAPRVAPVPASDNVTELIQVLDDKWGAAFNAGDFAGVAALYNPGALLIPPGSTDFVTQPRLEKFFAAGHKAGIKDVKLTAVLTLQACGWHTAGL